MRGLFDGHHNLLERMGYAIRYSLFTKVNIIHKNIITLSFPASVHRYQGDRTKQELSLSVHWRAYCLRHGRGDLDPGPLHDFVFLGTG